MIVTAIATGFISHKIHTRYDYLTYETFKSRQDSLTLLVDSLRNERTLIVKDLVARKDTIQQVTEEYEENYNILITLPVDSQLSFFSKYLSKTSK